MSPAPWCGNSNPGGVSGWVYKGRDREIGAYTGQELGIGPPKYTKSMMCLVCDML